MSRPGCGEKNQSAIQEARDQLFLDSADGNRLNAVTGNLGLDRPGFGFDDDEWRAVAKYVALQPKQIRNAFLRMLEMCAGPQFARIGTLEEATLLGDRQLKTLDAGPFIQVGELVIDPTLPTEETVRYCIRDLTTREFQLQTALAFNHAVISPGDDRLASAVVAGALSLPLINSSKLPTSGFPYPVMVDRGTLSEEVVQVTGNNTGTNTLTIAAPGLVYNHDGPLTQYLRKELAAAAPAGRTFILLPLDDTRSFPAAGWIRLDQGGGNDEVVEYIENAIDDNVLHLRTPLQNSHLATESVELVLPGAPVEVAQVVELGVHWFLFETAPRTVKVLLPQNFQPLGPLDATWLHGAVPAAIATTLVTATAVDDMLLHVTSVAGFPDEAGMLTIGGAQRAFYTLRLAQGDVTATVKTNTLAGDQMLVYQLAALSLDFPNPVGSYKVIIDPGGGNQETATVTFTDLATGTMTFAAPLVNPHVAGEVVRLLNQLLLDKPVGIVYAPAVAVALFRVPYAATDLEEGNSRDAFGAIQLDRFPGGYIFDVTQRGVSAVNTLLALAVPPEINVAFSQLAGRTNLEVNDASLWPAPPFTPFTVRIGESSGLQEDRFLIDRTLKRDVSATVQVGSIIGDTTLDYTLVSVIDFPESDGINPAGYRVIIDPGGANEEIATVNQNDTGTTVLSFVAPLTVAHVIGEQILMLNDTMTFDLLTQPHAGPAINPSRFGESLRAFIDSLEVSPAPTSFPPTGGIVWLNFGKEMLNVRKRIAGITGPTIYQLSSTADLPTSGYPYQVTLGDGLFVEEKVFVTNNNVGLSELTFAAPGALNAHAVGEYAVFVSGTPEVVEYRQKLAAPDRLVFQVPLLLGSRHLVGERVIYSPAISASREDGSSYGFKLPPDPGRCLKLLFELVRAAGIKVIVVQP